VVRAGNGASGEHDKRQDEDPAHLEHSSPIPPMSERFSLSKCVYFPFSGQKPKACSTREATP